MAAGAFKVSDGGHKTPGYFLLLQILLHARHPIFIGIPKERSSIGIERGAPAYKTLRLICRSSEGIRGIIDS
jgi:hypothetical protein